MSKEATTPKQDLYALLKIVATSKRGVMNLGDGSELDRVEAALAALCSQEETVRAAKREALIELRIEWANQPRDSKTPGLDAIEKLLAKYAPKGGTGEQD